MCWLCKFLGLVKIVDVKFDLLHVTGLFENIYM